MILNIGRPRDTTRKWRGVLKRVQQSIWDQTSGSDVSSHGRGPEEGQTAGRDRYTNLLLAIAHGSRCVSECVFVYACECVRVCVTCVAGTSAAAGHSCVWALRPVDKLPPSLRCPGLVRCFAAVRQVSGGSSSDAGRVGYLLQRRTRLARPRAESRAGSWQQSPGRPSPVAVLTGCHLYFYRNITSPVNNTPCVAVRVPRLELWSQLCCCLCVAVRWWLMMMVVVVVVSFVLGPRWWHSSCCLPW